jgi:hypothetical protein
VTVPAWYLKRLRVMSAREVLHRAGRQAALLPLLLDRRRGATAAPAATAVAFCRAGATQLPLPPFDLPALRRAAPQLLEARLRVAGHDWHWQAAADPWHRAPDSGRLWPRRFFARIPYREGNPTGDIRQLWEPARLQHLVDLALLAREGWPERRAEAVDLILGQFRSWVADNPPLVGPHYISAMECALRLIAVCHSLDLIREDVSTSDWEALIGVIASHAPLIARRLSLHSSTGNHTAAEAAGLVYAGLLFPEFTNAATWHRTGLSLLERVAADQILSDGGGAEQAIDYHRFNVQLLALVRTLQESHQRPVPAALAAAVDRGGAFLAAMKGTGIGDGDGGQALSRHMKPPGGRPQPAPAVRLFDRSGYTVARVGDASALMLTFDHGPLGMAPSFGHGHADALAVLLHAGAQPIFTDTGTYAYAGAPDWRRYFRGTGAHNTVRVDGQDQARQEAGFLWSQPYRAGLVAAEFDGGASGRVLAEHDGYRHLGVRHLRAVAWTTDQWLLIWDGLFGDGCHRLELHWHLAAAPVWHGSDRFRLASAAGALECRCEGGDITELSASTAPTAGWHAPAYGVLEPLTTLRIDYNGPLPHHYTTLIRLPGGNRADRHLREALAWITERAQ